MVIRHTALVVLTAVFLLLGVGLSPASTARADDTDEWWWQPTARGDACSLRNTLWPVNQQGAKMLDYVRWLASRPHDKDVEKRALQTGDRIVFNLYPKVDRMRALFTLDATYGKAATAEYNALDAVYGSSGDMWLDPPQDPAVDITTATRKITAMWGKLRQIPCVPSAKVSVSAWVAPAQMAYGAYPVLYGRTRPGAQCDAAVNYSTGYDPVSFPYVTRRADPNGVVTWRWHQETIGASGLASVWCHRGNQWGEAMAGFTVSH